MEWNDDFRKALKRPFQARAVKWKAQATSKDKTQALAVAFIDARNVMERLDRTVGPGEWSDAYEIIAASPDEFVVECRLTVLGVTKADVGDSSASGGGSNLAKSAYSDALKRAAVKFGIGRYLYALPRRWVAYDAQRKRLVEDPQLPTWAIPGGDDLGEDAPFEEGTEEGKVEIPLKPREESKPREEPKPVPNATANPGEYVLDFGKKYRGKTLAAIHAKDPSYLTWIADTSNAKAAVKMAVGTFLGWIAAKDKAEPPPGFTEEPDDDGQHWSEDEAARKRFYANLRGFKMSSEEAHAILVGSADGHLADYAGSIGDALMLCRGWAVEEGRIPR